jgi:prepilin-type N-terminal cleavage/methylation domain-containing protein
MRERFGNKGFTLIELLIVVAIIAILALIAVPNFLEAQTRARVARVKSDMRSLATALESYRVDYNGVPQYDSWEGVNAGVDRLTMRVGYFWRMLTTPISYITSPFRDPFVVIGRHSSTILDPNDNDSDLLDPWIQVGTGDPSPSYDEQTAAQLWCMVSYGPDQADNTINLGPYPFTNTACPYDPTNGTVSRGDVYRHSGREPSNYRSDFNQSSSPNPWW